MTLAADVALIGRLADAATAAVRPFWRAGPAIDTKSDRTPVTQADRAAEAAMRRLLERDRPTDGILGEEYGLQPGTSGRLWVLDPIDGTRAFIAGRPLWGTLVGLVEDGRPILGLISAPMAADRWLGCALGTPWTEWNGRPVRTRACPGLASARAASTHPLAFTAAGHAAFQRIGGAVADMLFGGDCHNYGLLASGQLDLVIEDGLAVHDWAALVPVIEGAGGIVSDWTGAPMSPASGGRVLAAGDARVHEAVLARI